METVVKHYDSVESLDEVPEHLVDGIRRLFTKKRVLDPKTFPLFLRADLTELIIYDCAALGTGDYIRVFAQLPRLKTLVLHNAYQFKDEVVDYMMEKALHLQHLTLHAANLVSSDKWSELFRAADSNSRR